MKKLSLILVILLAWSGIAFAEQQEITICKAVIATVMNQHPSIMSGHMKGLIPYVRYNRPNDGTLWRYKCQINGGDVVWASQTGRWRYEDFISYEIHGDTITVKDFTMENTESFTITK